jgi:hypothetical protein
MLPQARPTARSEFEEITRFAARFIVSRSADARETQIRATSAASAAACSVQSFMATPR